MIRDLLLALGVLLSTASQLRPQAFPIGPGEFCLAIWVALTMVYEVGRLGPPLTSALSRLLIFWVVFAFAQCIGLFVGLAIEAFRDTSGALHDMVAYVLMASMTCLIVSMPENRRRLRRVTWLIIGCSVASLVVQLAAARGLINIPAINPWYWNRFRGWSENPNQMALLCCALVLLSLHLAETAVSAGEKFAAMGCAGFNFLVGVLTRSDTFILFVLIACPMFVAFKLWSWLFLAERELSLRTTFASLAFLAVPVLLVGAAPLAPRIAEEADRITMNTLEDNNQAEARFTLWKEATEVGVGSWMLGLGPGPHLTGKDFKRPPPAKFEAHNTVLDLFTQGGAIAVMCFCWLIVSTFLVAHRTQLFALSTLACSLGIFSMFHFIVRQPVFWFAIAFCLAASEGMRGVALARKRSS